MIASYYQMWSVLSSFQGAACASVERCPHKKVSGYGTDRSSWPDCSEVVRRWHVEALGARLWAGEHSVLKLHIRQPVLEQVAVSD